jgi:ribose transport system permease protein
MSRNNSTTLHGKDQPSLWSKFMSMNGSAVLIALVIWVLFCSLFVSTINPGAKFNAASTLISVFKQQAYMGVIACGLTLVMITGNIDLSVGSMLTLLACICGKLLDYGTFVALFGTLAIGALFGLINAILVSGLRLNAFISTLAMGSVYGSVAIIYTSGGYIKPDQTKNIAFQQIFGKGSIGFLPAPVIVLAVVCVVLGFVLARTVFGQRLYTIGSNLTAARFSGVHVRRDVGITYVITGMTVALAAIMMMANVMSANPQAASGKEMDIIMSVVLGGTAIQGGKGNIIGTVIGFTFIGFLSSGFTALGMSEGLQMVIEGIILVVALSSDVMKERGVSLWKKK